jgi:methionyl-tRNA formyltransferase
MLKFSIIASETSRSLIYLTRLLEEKLYPEFVIYLKNDSETPIMGQKQFGQITGNSDNEVFNFILAKKLRFICITQAQFLSEDFPDLIVQCDTEIFVYSGYGGVILPKHFFKNGRTYIHAHGGILPEYKGSTTNYYSHLAEQKIGASTIIMNEELDSGPILNITIKNSGNDIKEMDHVVDSELRVASLISVLREKKLKEPSKHDSDNRPYFVMHPILKHLAILQS